MNMMKHKRFGFVVALAVPLLLLIALTVKPLWTLTSGDDVSLLTASADPSNVLYGGFLSVQYEIEVVPKVMIPTALMKKMEKKYSPNKIKSTGSLHNKTMCMYLKACQM